MVARDVALSCPSFAKGFALQLKKMLTSVLHIWKAIEGTPRTMVLPRTLQPYWDWVNWKGRWVIETTDREFKSKKYPKWVKK